MLHPTPTYGTSNCPISPLVVISTYRSSFFGALLMAGALFAFLRKELLVLDRLLYRNTSQHRSTKYFMRVLEVRVELEKPRRPAT